MKRTIIALLTVVMLIMMMLPADIAVAKEHKGQGPAATNETTESLMADFTFDIPTCPFCAGITFTDKSSGGVLPYAYYWDFGDGNNSTEQNPTHHYASYGNDTVTLTITDSAGDATSKSRTVTLAPKVNAGLDSSISLTSSNSSWPRCISGCTANDVEVHSDGVWLVVPAGDYAIGQTVTGTVNMTLYFHRQNTYCIVVVADLWENDGETPKTANWVSPIIGYHDSAVDGDSTTYSMGTVNWTYGKLFEMRNILIMWSQNSPPGGTCPTDNCSEYGSPSKCSQVSSIIVHTPLVADFSSSTVCYCHNTTFADNTTGGVEPYAYDWDFGGDYTYSGDDPTTLQNPVIHYNESGNYTVTLNVTDDEGTWDIQSHDVTVYANPKADAGVNEEIYKGSSVGIGGSPTASNGTSPYTYSWSPTTGLSNAHVPNPSASPTSTTTYTVTVTDDHDCKDSDSVVVTVIARALEITADSNSKIYDGTPLTDTGYSITAGSLAPGDTLDSVTVTGSQTNVGSSPNIPSAAVIKDGTVDVTANYDITYVNGSLTVTAPITPAAGAAGCPTTKYLTVDWEGNNTTKPLYSNDKLAVDLLGPSSDLANSLFLERATHAPIVEGTTRYLIVIRELEEYPALPENTQAVVVYNVTPTGAVFDKNIFLTLGLTDAQLPATGNVTMVYYDDMNHVWVPLNYEAGGPSGVAELTLSAPINHFSIYGILAQLAPTPIQPAHFVPSGLNIVPSVEKTIFVTRTGESVTITANIANDGGQEGTYSVVLKLNGQTVATKTVTVGAGQSKQVSFTQSGLAYGRYQVNVAGLTDSFTASRAIAWWLIILIVVAAGLIIWGIVWAITRRRKGQQEV
jgi:PKD repeat protein